MLTEGQIKYLATIPDDQKMVVKPFNPKGLDVANRIISDIKAVEPYLEVVCLGSLPLKIAGQEDIDISAFCIKSEQPKHFDNFKKLFGEPTRKGTNSTGWDFQKDGFGVSVWLTDPTVETTINQVKVFNLLKNNPDLLKEYEKIKEEAKDLTYKEYQVRKYEFYNRILGLNKVEAKSYGVIPIFKSKDDFYILLVKNSKGGHWGLPKGTPEKDEKSIDTARRELFEETGIKDIEIKMKPTLEERYGFEQDGTEYSKTNTYYLGFVSKMTKGNRLDEIDELKWVKIDEAQNTLTHQSAIDVVKKLAEHLK
ncbi:MAG: hypothetical protein A3J47_03445 [Candidatus Yanofskybacteria bacterium RIFCSPHIGHO2_02_FULL_43_22]|uniref:Nudix hydrolase domain-containing protein n=1 Tax=Candidatus Yanofskybacteria bacterium RIFCSPHIGHO2_02_FULL_43_22 TaxID=1802681 RepID=A0A1F8FLD5_9BACT|nr:MAG: hypothetical protein A3J47_03445 [Candidatus Yanofskybacteria bacterium RIFCSPHIGHO2_02_FULL_43_22]